MKGGVTQGFGLWSAGILYCFVNSTKRGGIVSKTTFRARCVRPILRFHII